MNPSRPNIIMEWRSECDKHSRSHVMFWIIAVVLLASQASAVQSPRETFERARMLEESNQNLAEAIKLYSQVISEAGGQRALAAEARYRIGILYNRLGKKAEAQAAF